MTNKIFLKKLLVLSFWFSQILPTSFSVTADGQTLTLDGDYFLGIAGSLAGVYGSIVIDNTTGATRTATLDGAGHTVYFPYNTASPTFQFTGDGVVLTTQNVNFKGYNPAAISYVSANAKIIFGDNTKIVLDRDLSILYTDRTWTCSGNVLLDGQNLTLTASGESALSMQGLNKALTIKNTTLKPQGPDSIACLDGASKIVLSNSTLELGRDGMVVNNGYIDIDGKVLVRGIDISYTGTQSLALLSKRYQNLGFVPYLGNCKLGIYTLGLADVYSGNATFTTVHVNKENRAFYATSTNPYSVTWTEIVPSAVYKSIDVGDDGQMWVVKTDRSVHRVTRGAPPTLTAASNITGDYVAVGGENYVFVLNTATGVLYQCNNPTGTPNSWTAVSGLYFPRSIAAGNDGTLWFVATDGRVYKKPYQSDKIEQIFDGIDRDVVKISASGTADSNCIAVLTSMPKDGRVLISQSGGPFRDLGINKIVDVGIGINGSMVIVFDNTAIAENATFGGLIYSKINSCAAQILTIDRSLTFSSDKSFTIKSNSELELTNDVALRYQPNVLAEVNYNRRRHLVFQDYSSSLKLNRAILDCGPYGLTLTNGNMTFEGLSTLYTNTEPGRELEISSDVNLLVRSDANLSVIGPISYSDSDRLYPLGYFDVYGPTEATVKSGVTDPVSYQAISDAYSRGFKAIGTNSSDWLYSSVAVLDNSVSYTSDPEVLTLRNTDSTVSHIKLKDASRQTYGGGVVGNKCCDISVDGYFAYSESDVNNSLHLHQSPRPLFTTAGVRTHITVSAYTRVNFDYSFATNTAGGIYAYSWAINGWGPYYGVPGALVNATTIDGTVICQSIASGSDYTHWRIDLTSGNVVKKEANGSESTVTSPAGLVGSIISISAKGTTSTNYLAIASSTGQAFLSKDNGSWQNLGLSGVVKIAVGVRGTIAVLVKRDSTAHGTLFPLLVRPGL